MARRREVMGPKTVKLVPGNESSKEGLGEWVAFAAGASLSFVSVVGFLTHRTTQLQVIIASLFSCLPSVAEIVGT
jgi:hypothetical protein